MSKAWINPWFALRRAAVPIYLTATALLLVISAYVANVTCNWTWVSRVGGVVILFGILLSLRRLIRLGPAGADEPDEPQVLRGKGKFVQFNLAYVQQSMERLTDNYATVAGVTLMVLGTIAASYGDIALDLLVPLSGCGA